MSHPIRTTNPPRRRHLRDGVAVVLATTGLTVGGVSLTSAASDPDRPAHTLEVDVAEDGTRFVIAESPVFDDGFPAYGNPFITQGYIYPAGTLTGSNGVNADGSPEFPDRVIGEWSCTGYYISEGAHTTEGAWVYTTQLFAFGDDADTGAETIVVTGYEGAEVGQLTTGAITGGTGTYTGAHREADQELLGMNNPDLVTMGINKTVVLELEP